MPRGVKGSGTGQRGRRKSLDSKISEAQATVNSLHAKLTEAERVLAGYKQEQQNTDMASILKLMEENGVSADQLSAMIQSKPAE